MTHCTPATGRSAPMLVALLGCPALLPPAPPAQTRLPIDPMQGEYDRDLRTLQGQAGTDPAGAAAGAAVIQRRLENESGGGRLRPARAPARRRLQALRQAPLLPEPATSQPQAPDTRLPSSYG